MISKLQYILSGFPPDSQSSLTNKETTQKPRKEEQEEAVKCKDWLLLMRLVFVLRVHASGLFPLKAKHHRDWSITDELTSHLTHWEISTGVL